MSMAQGVFFKEAIKLVDIYSALFANLTVQVVLQPC